MAVKGHIGHRGGCSLEEGIEAVCSRIYQERSHAEVIVYCDGTEPRQNQDRAGTNGWICFM